MPRAFSSLFGIVRSLYRRRSHPWLRPGRHPPRRGCISAQGFRPEDRNVMLRSAHTRARYALFGALLLAACSNRDKASQEAPRPREMMFPVEVQKLEPRRVEYKIEAVGAVEAFENVQVTARVAGALESLHFREGDEVKQGALLAEIEPQRYQLAAGQAKASLDRAKAARAEAERE